MAFLALLYAVALLSLMSLATVQLASLSARRQAEDELLFVGAMFRQALESFQAATPAGSSHSAPRSLQELLHDPRVLHVQRHLRAIYPDPVTGRPDWALIRRADGGIVGIHSLSQDMPLRQTHFPDDFFYFEGRTRYADWIFTWGVVCQDQGCDFR